MENKNKQISIGDIELMNEAEWNNYRVSLWNKKRESYSGSAPSWYMASKKEYLDFFKKKGFSPKIYSIDQIESMDDNQWTEFRNNQWKTKGKKYQTEMPEWYLQDKKQFISFLKKNMR